MLKPACLRFWTGRQCLPWPKRAKAPPRWLSEADLRRWRACPRQLWLHQRHGEAANAPLPAPAEPDVVSGPEPAQALRASFPDALAIPEPQAETD